MHYTCPASKQVYDIRFVNLCNMEFGHDGYDVIVERLDDNCLPVETQVEHFSYEQHDVAWERYNDLISRLTKPWDLTIK